MFRFKPRHVISMALCASQLLWAVPSFAVTQSPEFELVQSAFALQGSGLSQEQLNAQLGAILARYNDTAPEAGRAERLEQALIDLKLYTPAQAESMIADAKSAENGLSNGSATEAQNFSNALARLAEAHPMGAQFSNCGPEDAGATFVALGSVAFVAGAILHYQQSCDAFGCVYPNRGLGNNLMLGGGIAAGVGLVLVAVSAPSCG